MHMYNHPDTAATHYNAPTTPTSSNDSSLLNLNLLSALYNSDLKVDLSSGERSVSRRRATQG